MHHKPFYGVLVPLLAVLAGCGTSGTAPDGGRPDGGNDDGGLPDGGSALTCDTGGSVVSTGAVSYTGTFPTASGDHDVTLTVSGLARQVFVYLPTNRGVAPPLIIALHGTGGGQEIGQGRDIASQFQPLADAQGIVLIGPESRVQPNPDWDQHSGGEKYWETIPDEDPSRGCDINRNPDLLLVRAVIQEAKRAYGVDPKRIYVLGFSNGGFFSLAVSVALRDQIAAFLELSAGLVRCDNTNSCSFAGTSTTCEGLRAEPGYCACTGGEKPIKLPTTGRMPPALISHGNQDYTVSVVYSCDLAARLTELGHVAVVNIRGGDDHAVPNYADPAIYGPLWTFFDTHRLP